MTSTLEAGRPPAVETSCLGELPVDEKSAAAVSESHAKYFQRPVRQYSEKRVTHVDDEQQNPKPHVIGKDQEQAQMRGYYALPLDQAKMPGIAIVMVGLPGRGKTYLSRSLMRYMNWLGVETRIFNFGLYRRNYVGGDHPHNDYQPNSPFLQKLAQVLPVALADVKKYLSETTARMAIFDATNTTRARRKEVFDSLRTVVGDNRVIFLETYYEKIDQAQKERYIASHIRHSEDYLNMNPEEAREDFRRRIEQYESAYEIITKEEGFPFIRMVDAGRKMETYKLEGYLNARMFFMLMNMHSQPKMIFLYPQEVTDDSAVRSPRDEDAVNQVIPIVSADMKAWGADHSDMQLTIWTDTLTKLPKNMSEHLVQQWKILNDLREVVDFTNLENEANLLEPMVFEMERVDTHVLVVANPAVCKIFYMYLTESDDYEKEMPAGTLYKIVPGAYGASVTETKIGA